MVLYYPPEGQRDRPNAQHMSLLAVGLQSFLYYDEIFSYFALIFQYFIFVYKYNILLYEASTIAGQIIILSILLVLNYFRIVLGRYGNKGKKYSYLFLFFLLDILLIIGCIYIIALQSNALYLEVIISVIEIVFASINFILTICVLILYRINE